MTNLLVDAILIILTVKFISGNFSPCRMLVHVLYSTVIMCIATFYLELIDQRTFLLRIIVIVTDILMLGYAYKDWKKQKLSKI